MELVESIQFMGFHLNVMFNGYDFQYLRYIALAAWNLVPIFALG